jgi:general secretion pathway protein M
MAVELSSRDRRLLTIGGVVLGILVLVGVPVGAEAYVSGRRADNDELRAALSDVQDARTKVRERQGKKDSVVARYAKPAPQLGTFIEQTARANKLEVVDSVDRQPVPHGKKYSERHTIIHFKKAGMLAIAKFLEAVEKSGHPVSVSRLNIRKRTGEPDSYDVEVGLSAFDRTPDPVKPPASAAPAPTEKKP